MKIKNKKRTNIIVAAFLAVFVIGSAFAFTPGGPLNFNGTVNIEAAVQIVFTDADAIPSTGIVLPAPYTINLGQPDPATGFPMLTDDLYQIGSTSTFDTWLDNPVTIDGDFTGYKDAFMTVDFRGRDEVITFEFRVENTGTMPAILNDITVVDLDTGHNPSVVAAGAVYGFWFDNTFYSLADLQAGDLPPFMPGDHGYAIISVRFNARNYTGYEMFEGPFEFEAVVSYIPLSFTEAAAIQ